ncbi:MAG TPA: ABC transporter ATP-binding protein [Acetobacteraceae bacterium]|nr:ABC transporter ATP-binding protein [Acetobacteraceae bacterium]
MSEALAVEALTSGYGEAMVLRDVSLRVMAGEVLAVLGKNGMGKTTLLKTIMGFLPAYRGQISIFSKPTIGEPPHHLAGRAVAYSPQEQAIFQELTVEENLKLGLGRRARFAPELKRVAAFFPFLAERRRQLAGTLSGGEQKMLIMARALIARPKLMLVDEITEGLQPSIVLRLADVLRQEKSANGTAILLIEQNISFALSVADRYAVLSRGEVVDEGDARQAGADTGIAERLSV